MNGKIDIRRWNYETHSYDPFTTNPEWKLIIYTDDMELLVNCPSCGKVMRFGDGFTSKELHNHMGIGWSVCDDCYQGEVIRARVYREAEHS